MHRSPSHAVRARGDSPDSPGPGSESPPGSVSESGSESGPAGGRRREDRVNLLGCPGCGKTFASAHSLRLHRSSRWLVNSPCQRAVRMGKRPRIIARAAHSDSGSDAPEELLNLALGVGPNADLPPGAAPPNPLVQPSDRVSDAPSESAAGSSSGAPVRGAGPRNRFVLGLYVVWARFVRGLFMVGKGL